MGKNINIQNPSDLKDYLDNKLTGSDRHEFEKKALEHDFDSEAMEGFENSPDSINDLPELQEKVSELINSESNVKKNVFLRFAIAASIIGIIAYTGVRLFDNSVPKELGISQKISDDKPEELIENEKLQLSKEKKLISKDTKSNDLNQNVSPSRDFSETLNREVDEIGTDEQKIPNITEIEDSEEINDDEDIPVLKSENSKLSDMTNQEFTLSSGDVFGTNEQDIVLQDNSISTVEILESEDEAEESPAYTEEILLQDAFVEIPSKNLREETGKSESRVQLLNSELSKDTDMDKAQMDPDESISLDYRFSDETKRTPKTEEIETASTKHSGKKLFGNGFIKSDEHQTSENYKSGVTRKKSEDISTTTVAGSTAPTPELIQEKEGESITHSANYLDENDNDISRAVSEYKVYYALNEYKVVDYSGKFALMEDENTDAIGGIPAKFESDEKLKENNSPLNALETTASIPYADILNSALINFKIENFEASLEKLNLIKQQFPEDNNVLFYSGMNLLEQKEYDKAMGFFNKLIIIKNSPFQEESEFHKAECLIGLNKKTEAKALLNAIISNNSFYSERAKEILKSL